MLCRVLVPYRCATRQSATRISGQQDDQDCRGNQADAEDLGAADLFLEEQQRDDKGKQQFDLAQRADVGCVLQRERGKPADRRQAAADADETCRPPVTDYFLGISGTVYVFGSGAFPDFQASVSCSAPDNIAIIKIGILPPN